MSHESMWNRLHTRDICSICQRILVYLAADTRDEDLRGLAERDRPLPCRMCSPLVAMCLNPPHSESTLQDQSADVAADYGASLWQWRAIHVDPPYSSRTILSLVADDPPGDVQQPKQWLDECCAGHKSCNANASNRPSKLPSRVVEIISREGVRVLSGSTMIAKYATLSYCWGFKLPFKTTRANLAQHEIGILRKELPRLFQDAMNVVERLGLRYIWIDSLCIVQDDLSEWEAEAANMASVFQNSHITLAATAAQDPSVGLFPQPFATLYDLQRQSSMPRSRLVAFAKFNIRLPMVDTAVKDTTAIETADFRDYTYLENCTLDFALHLPADPLQDIVQAPLNTRGWTLQELILSPRTLHFTGVQTYWHCNELAASSDDRFRNPEGVFATDYGPDLRIMTWDRQVSYERWWALIADYSNRLLTFKSDKSIALQGIVTAIQDRQPDEYLHGHWRGDFPRGLLWTPKDSPSEVALRNIPADVPAWSWLSCDGRVELQSGKDMTFVSLCCLVDAPSPLEKATPARITLRSHVFHAAVRLHNGMGRQSTELYIVSTGLRTPTTLPSAFHLYSRFDRPIGNEHLINFGSDVLAIPITCETYVPDADASVLKLRFLLVVQDHASENEYRRVGTAACYSSRAQKLGEIIDEAEARDDIVLI